MPPGAHGPPVDMQYGRETGEDHVNVTWPEHAGSMCRAHVQALCVRFSLPTVFSTFSAG